MGKLIVQKYGGTSVADASRIREVAKRVVAQRKKGHSLVVVVSALGDTTDNLVSLSAQVSKRPQEREMDLLLSTGEQVSASLLAMAIKSLGAKAMALTGSQIGIVTDRAHTQARIQEISVQRIQKALDEGFVVTVAGFQGITPDQEITTLGRGGSDLSAVALACALKAKVCEIYTDVDGVYTADPRIVPTARKLSRISYDEMLELASLGSQVMQARSVQVAKRFGVRLHLRSSFSKSAGTFIVKEVKAMEQMVVSGVTLQKDEAKVTICDVPDRPGVAAKIFKRIGTSKVNVDMIIQNETVTGQTDISFTVARKDLRRVLQVARAVTKEVKGGRVTSDPGIAKLSVVGLGMRSHSGIAAKMFTALAEESVNIGMISTSEIKISITIRREQGPRAARALHDAFGLNKKRAGLKKKSPKRVPGKKKKAKRGRR